jgi:ribose transport system permease protein
MFIWVASLQPDVANYEGITLLFSGAVPLAATAMAEMFVISIGDIDVGIGYFVGLTNAVVAQYMPNHPLGAWGLLVVLVGAYVGMGALIQLGRVPSIVATLGASFIWMGAGLVILPIPGGSAPGWLTRLFNSRPPFVPFPIVAIIVLVVVCGWLTSRYKYGVAIRAMGANAQAVGRNGWSLLRLRMTCFGLAGIFGVIAGFAVTAVADSGAPTSSADYTLLAVAAVILGGAEFSGGFAFPLGAAAGALAISQATSLLTFLNISSNYQGAVVGLILMVVLLGRVLTRSRNR